MTILPLHKTLENTTLTNRGGRIVILLSKKSLFWCVYNRSAFLPYFPFFSTEQPVPLLLPLCFVLLHLLGVIDRRSNQEQILLKQLEKLRLPVLVEAYRPMSEPKMKNMSKFIPKEVVEQILSKLPIKSLLRFLTVSKEWYKLIPTLKLDNRCPQLLVAFYDIGNDVHDYRILKNGSFEEYVTYNVGTVLEGMNTVAVANGLMCIYDISQVAILWNSSTRRSFRLPDSDINPEAISRSVLGIVRDNITNDYKILRRVVCIRYGDDLIMETFRLSTGSWEVVNGKFPYFSINRKPQVDLNGISYWIAYSFTYSPVLISFDGHEESFGWVDLDIPGYPDGGYEEHWLLLFKESLVIVTKDDIGNYKIWKMEPSESKSLNLWCEIYFDNHVSPLAFRENGDFIWLIDGHLQYVSITLADGFTTRSISIDLDDTLRCPHLYCYIYSIPNYVESLDLLDLSLKQSQHPSL